MKRVMCVSMALILAALCVFLSFYSYISEKKEKNSAA